jgi:hypothetical protein
LCSGVQYAQQHRPLSLEQLGAMLSRYIGADQRRACAVGFAKGAFLRLDEAYAGWEIERQRRDKDCGRRRTEERPRSTLRWSTCSGSGTPSASIVLKEYRRTVLGQKV